MAYDDWGFLASNPPYIVRSNDRYRAAADEYDPDRPDTPIWHLDGVPADRHRAPGRRHLHWAQTVSATQLHEPPTYRCPCGAFGSPDAGWKLLAAPRVRRIRRIRPLLRTKFRTFVAVWRDR